MKIGILSVNRLGVARIEENRDVRHEWVNPRNLLGRGCNQDKLDFYYFLMLRGHDKQRVS